MLPILGVQVQSPVTELRSCRPHGVAKKTLKKYKMSWFMSKSARQESDSQRALHHGWVKSAMDVILRTCESFHHWTHVGPASPGGGALGWGVRWDGSNTTMILTVPMFLWSRGALEVISWKTRPVETATHIVLCTENWLSTVLSCVRRCSPLDCSPPGFSVHGIFQARILEWVAIYSRDLPDPGTKPKSSASPALADIFFTTSATWELVMLS